MIYEVISDTGLVRTNNEDYFYVPESLEKPLFIVADGIGGQNYGEIASKMAVKTIVDNIKEHSYYGSLDELEEDFVKSITLTNETVFSKSNSNENFKGMGTTLTILYFFGESILIGHVGDSRVYAIGDKKIKQLTDDDTYVNSLVNMGAISQNEAEVHPKRNIITNAIGTDIKADISLVQYNYTEGEYILMCTDGLTDMVSNEEIYETIMKYKNPKMIKEELLKLAINAGGKDNITFIIIKI